MDTELDKFWKQAPKFPDESEDRIDVDSFVQIYRDIDDLFEDDDDASSTTTTVSLDDTPDEDEVALEQVFETLSSNSQLITKDVLQGWDEIARLLDDGLLGDDEFESLWSKTQKSPGTTDTLDVDGFLSFNVFLDDLFVFDESELLAQDDDNETDEEIADSQRQVPQNRPMVNGEDLPPGVLFAALANEDYLVGSNELLYWSELQEMLKDGELQPQELQDFYAANAVKKNGGNFLTEDTFVNFFNSIDDLFEDDDEEEEEEPVVENEAKVALLEFFDEFATNADRLPCGLESEEKDEKLVQNIVSVLENDAVSNVIQKKGGNIGIDDVLGDWRLLYCSSAAVKFNQGLSGIGGSFPNGKFGGLTQKLEFSKFKQDVTYKEQIDCIPESSSFEVTVNGAWDLRKSISLFTNKPCTMLSVEPDRVRYGPTSTRADHWKSLGPMNMLDVTYLDDDLRIMRGNTATDSIFVFQRI